MLMECLVHCVIVRDKVITLLVIPVSLLNLLFLFKQTLEQITHF